MKTIKSSIALLVSTCLLASCAKEASTTSSALATPPIAKKVPHKLVTQNIERIDNYYWMRDDSRSDPEIIQHLQQENAYTQAMLSHTEALQQTLYQEMEERINKNDQSVPYKKGNYWYYNRYEDGKEYPILARKKHTLDAPEEIYLDQNLRAEGQDYYYIADIQFSSNEKYLAWTEDTLSRNIYTVYFKNTETGEMLSDELTGADYNIMWANDNKTLFYINKDPQTLLGYQVYRHTLGTDQKDDVLVYEETDNSFYTSVYKSKDNSTLVISHESTKTVAASVLDANNPTGQFQRIIPLEDEHWYSIQPYQDWYYILSNGNQKDFELYRVDKQKVGSKKDWQLVIPHRPGNFINNGLITHNQIITHERLSGENSIRLYDLNGKALKTIAFEDKVNDIYLSQNKSSGPNTFRYSYSSLKTPTRVMEYNLDDHTERLLKQHTAGEVFDSSQYQTEQIFITARDNAQVPVSIIYRKDKFKKDGSNPLLQYAYGAYGATEMPYFYQQIFSLLDRGFVYAIAHIRGGAFMGFDWYEQGKMLNKKNSFTDFIDATLALKKLGYGHPDKFFAQGGSAGGLLMGAVSNMAAEEYLGIIAEVPFVDAITTMEDHSIPLTTGELNEWGDPRIKAQYDYIMSYSPYDQVKAQPYTNMLVTTGLHDSQVQYFEPMKWVAKLREFKTDDKLLLFRTDMESGHGGASGRYSALQETAEKYAFMLDLVGIEK